MKKRKGQYFLLGIIFTIAIALISVSTIVTAVSESFVQKYYEGDSTPDITVITTKESVVEKTVSWYESQGNETRNYKKYDLFSVSTNLSFNDEINDNLMSYVIPIDNVENLSNKMNIVEGNKEQMAPKEGEMWIPSTIADIKGIEVSDTAKIIDSNGKTSEYKISAIVNDSNQATTGVGILYLYVNEANRESLKELPKGNLITMNCDGDPSKKNVELSEYINEPLGGAIVDKNLYVVTSVMSASLAGGFGIIASIILIVVLILILRSNIKNNILKEYKSIGIYKSMGYSSKKIRRIYLYGYGLVSIVSSLLGILISIPMVSYICNIIFKYFGEYKFDITSLAIVTMAFILFNSLVYLNLYRVLKVVDKIKPVDAINIGLTSSQKKMKKSLISNSSSSFAMAFNDMFKYKKKNILILMIFTLVFYISVLFLNVANTMMTLDSSLYKVFGTANSDLVIAAPSDIEDSIKDVKEYLDNDDRVDNYYLWDVLGQSKVAIDGSKYNIDSGTLMAMTYDKYNNEDFSITEGVNPRNKNEVSLDGSILKNNNFKIGDYITIDIEGENKEFLIVGSYFSMMAGGSSIRLTNDVLSSGSNGNIAFVKLKNVEDYEGLKKDLDSKFEGISVDNIYAPLKNTASQVVDSVVPISLILLVGVLIFGIFNIIDTLITSNLDNRKNYGIMKSLGFDSKYIRRRSNFRIMTLAIIGAVIGVGVNVLSSDKLMKAALGYDILTINYSMTTILVAISFGLIIVTMHICNRSIKKISTVELIKE
ncbi:FtsX-like permease family protein [Clostridium paraputrificum]|uniref:ABC transporter permease n=1 Tax=Clostridium paraputrificum TaxID=29363 RepID=UPI003D3588B1